MKSLFILITILASILFAHRISLSGGELDTLSGFDDAVYPSKCWNVANGDKYCQQQTTNRCRIISDRDSVPDTYNQ